MTEAGPRIETASRESGPPQDLRARFDRQHQAVLRHGAPGLRRRLEALTRLLGGLLEHEEDIVAAISDDFGGRAPEETRALEMFPTVDAIRHARRHLRQWMRPRNVPTGWQFLPASSRVVYQPLGVVGIIGAWNYPLLVNLLPLVSAMAAGNHALVKPSEHTPRTGELLSQLIARLYPEDYVSVVVGGPEVGAAFAALPFDHILFTGSSDVGKSVMRAAAENLTPVTLELGGKSPVILHPSYSLSRAAGRIMAGKLFNAGQTCLAPDYLLLARESRQAFIRAAQESVRKMYPRLVATSAYTRILNRAHFRRLTDLISDARQKGATVLTINPAQESADEIHRVFAPTLLWDLNDEMRVLQEEIFGPILPLVVYGSLDEAIAYVNARPRPLALYYFDDDRSRVDDVVKRTRSGGVTVNDVLLHVAQNNLPFGGVGESGMGHYRGFDGFETFSKKRAVFLQSQVSATDLVRAPYGRWARWLIRFLVGHR